MSPPTLSLLTLSFFLLLSPSAATHHPCPPFPTSNPPFPFSSSSCAHPSFQFRCSTPHSLISINNISFSILTYNPNTSSILLSTTPPNKINQHFPKCSSTQFQPINFTGTPFAVTDATCHRLYSLQPCSPANCTHCPWQCNLINNPALLLRGCGSLHRSAASDSEPKCNTDVLGYLHNMLSLSGIELQWDESKDPYFSNCRKCRQNRGSCGLNSSDPNRGFVCFRSESAIHKVKLKTPPNKMAALTVAALLTSLLIVAAAAFVLRKRSIGLGKLPSSEEEPTAVFLRNNRSLLPPVFTYDELASSTNGFDPKRKIGDGGFGSVYLGQLHDGRIVAVKHLHRHNSFAAAADAGRAFSNKSFCNEILILSSINHPNLVKLHGYCSDPRGLLLVYDYVPNGTLADHLHGRCNRKLPMTWQVRLEIAVQIAMAMEYLHFSVVPPVVHKDITSSNIFVEKDMRVKVGDFGLSRLLVLQDKTASSTGNACVWTGPQGTPGYLDPDYHRSFRLTEKSDVYSFGVVLLELISGQRAVDQRREKREMALADMVVSRIQTGQLDQVVDPVLAAEEEGSVVEAVACVAELAFRCVAAEKDDRPDSKEVVVELRRVRNRSRGGDDVARRE